MMILFWVTYFVHDRFSVWSTDFMTHQIRFKDEKKKEREEKKKCSDPILQACIILCAVVNRLKYIHILNLDIIFSCKKCHFVVRLLSFVLMVSS